MQRAGGRMAGRSARARNPRGRGGRLRDELIQAASALLAEGRSLTLRSVAARAGVAATSVYLHFPTVEHLSAAVAARSFAEMGAALAAAEAGTDPRAILLARCRAYCAFALAHPGHYRVMFEADRPDLAPAVPYSLERSPGWPALERLAGNVRRCQEAGLAPPGDPLRQV